MTAGALLVLAALLGTPAAAQTPAFSTHVDAVRVDVLVTTQGQIVRGLQPADFEVLDDGVPQRVDLVTFERLPLNIVLVLDVSDSVAGQRLADLRAAGLALVNQLAVEDEAALVTFSHAVTINAPLTTVRGRVRAALEGAEGHGRTSLIDATHAAMIVGESGSGRSLLIVFSDGLDTSSWLSADAVLTTARRADVVIYGVFAGGRDKAEFTRELASLTGGALIEVASTRDLAATFVGILEEFRQRYVISYTPRGVATTGWHRLDVRLKGRRATVRARPGYLAGK